MIAALLAAVLVVVVAAPVAAQIRVDHRDPAYPAGFFDTLQPGTPVEGHPGLVWFHDGLGWVQLAATPAASPAPADAAPVCDPIPNPYAEPDRAAACSAWDAEHAPQPFLPTFEVGRAYKDHYDSFRMVVLTVTRSLEGVPVVTVQRTAPTPGEVFSFRASSIEAQRWERLP